MKMVKIKLLVLSFIIFTVLLNSISSKILLEDDFNKLDETKWDIIDGKHECNRFILTELTPCMRNNKLNVNTINGSLTLTALREKFFDGEYTSATIVSKKSFNLKEFGTKLIIKFRGAFRKELGHQNHLILLIPDKHLKSTKYHNNYKAIRVLDNKYEYIWKNQTNEINVHQFQDYQFEYYKETFKWILNQNEYIIRNEICCGFDSKIPFGHFLLESFESLDPLRLVITVHIDERNRERIPYYNGKCSALILDYLIVEELDDLNFEKVSNVSKLSVSEINNVCNELELISNLPRETEFIPNLSLKLVWFDEFEGRKLNESLWSVMVHQNKCEKYFERLGEIYEVQESCDVLMRDNIELNHGSLKLKVKKEESKYLGHEYTGITIATKMCFRNSRIEIRAKLPKGFLLNSAAFMSSFEYMCQQDERNGQVDIAKFFSDKDIHYFQSTLHYGSRDLRYSNRKLEINSNDWIMFGIEWSDTYLQTFMDGKVIYHANRMWSRSGTSIQTTNNPYHLPFDQTFNLMLHIGVRSFQLEHIIYNGYISEDQLKTWVLPVFQIDYVRVYGESVEGFRNDTIILKIPNDPPQIVSPIIYALIGVVAILVILIIIVIYYFMRKREQIYNQDNYDDIGEVENKYDEFDYSYAYEVVHYNNEENYQATPNEYLVLTDPMAETPEQNYEVMTDRNKV